MHTVSGSSRHGFRLFSFRGQVKDKTLNWRSTYTRGVRAVHLLAKRDRSDLAACCLRPFPHLRIYPPLHIVVDMAPSPSSLFRSLQASAFSSSIRLRALLPGLSPMAYALLALGISSYPFAASFVANHLRARAKAKKTRVKASIQIVHTLANAGVSRKVVAYAVAVTDYPLSVRHVESLRRIGEKNKALRKFIAARKQKDRQKLAEKRRREAEDAEDRRMDEERQKLEEEKRRLERIVKHERAVKLFGDVVNELRQLQRPQSCPPRTRN